MTRPAPSPVVRRSLCRRRHEGLGVKTFYCADCEYDWDEQLKIEPFPPRQVIQMTNHERPTASMTALDGADWRIEWAW
jgi:hypothetical protein